MDCGVKLVKYLVFIFNLVFFLTGLLLVILGGVGLASQEFEVIEESLGDRANLQNLSIGLIIFGVVVMIITFLGCCGAYKENACMLITFAVIIAVIFLAELIIGIVIFVKKDDIQDYIDDDREFKQRLLRGYYNPTDNQDSYQTLWNTVQRDYECCGYDDANNWRAFTGFPPPDSCCPRNSLAACSEQFAYSRGCKDAIKESVLDRNALLIGAGIIILALIQLMAIAFACCLARAVKSDGGGNVV